MSAKPCVCSMKPCSSRWKIARAVVRARGRQATVRVIAIAHQHRRPGYWRSRSPGGDGASARAELLLRQNAVVWVAIGPRFPDFGRGDDRMVGRVSMGACVPVRRVVAASNVAAAQTDPEVDPRRADFQAVLASGRGPVDRSRHRVRDVAARIRQVDRGQLSITHESALHCWRRNCCLFSSRSQQFCKHGAHSLTFEGDRCLTAGTPMGRARRRSGAGRSSRECSRQQLCSAAYAVARRMQQAVRASTAELAAHSAADATASDNAVLQGHDACVQLWRIYPRARPGTLCSWLNAWLRAF